MTPATAKTRQRRAKTTTALVPRGQHLIDQGADFLILSARMAETPLPVFWAEGELDARTTLAVHADGDYDDNYRRVLDEGWDWDWYRAAALAAELEAIPVVTVTLDTGAPVLMPGTQLREATGQLPADLEDKLAEFLSEPGFSVDAEGRSSWRQLIDVPGPDEGADPPSVPHASAAEASAPGPGTRDEDNGDG